MFECSYCLCLVHFSFKIKDLSQIFGNIHYFDTKLHDESDCYTQEDIGWGHGTTQREGYRYVMVSERYSQVAFPPVAPTFHPLRYT